MADELMAAMRRAGLGEQGINMLVNDGPDANQHVPHLHLHLIPRRRGDLAGLLWRALTRFLPLGRTALQARLEREADLLRRAMKREP